MAHDVDEKFQASWQRALKVLQPTDSQLEHGLELHRDCFACDTFSFLPIAYDEAYADLYSELKEGSVGARELQWRMGMMHRPVAPTRSERAAREFVAAIEQTGLNCIVQTVAEGKSREEDLKRMATSRQLCRVFRKTIAQAGSSQEIREIQERGAAAVVWSVNGPPIVGKLIERDEELSWVETWYQLGVRLMHLTYNRRNLIGDGCAEASDGGLSELGRDLICEMNRVGLIVDIPHSGRQTTLDAAAASEKPIMASHTGAESVFQHIRCKSDEELKAVAATDGLIGVYALPNMLGPEATLNTLLDHLNHIAKTVGTDHVCIGTDTTYSAPYPEEMTPYIKPRFDTRWWGNWNEQNQPLPPSDEGRTGSLAWTNWPLYTVGLVMRGYTDEDIAKILGGNFLRVLDANRPSEEVVM